jgi:pimeloyl-ACP methyl ester carboxylesterase
MPSAPEKSVAPAFRPRVRAANRVGGFSGLPLAELSEWQMLLESYDADDLTFIGRVIARQMIINQLSRGATMPFAPEKSFAPSFRPRVRAANRVGGFLRRSGLPLAELSESSVVRAAEEKTGLSDWGDQRFRVPLQILLESYDADNLTFVGRVIARQMIINLLSNRLRVIDDHARDPAIAAGAVERPLFVVGLPRTGTTLLFNLLAQDPGARPLLYWETMQPSPPPDPTRDDDPRIARAERVVGAMYSALPALRSIHDIQPRGPEECLGLLMNTIVTPFFVGPIPAYRDWLRSVDGDEMKRVYAEYQQQLQVLQLHDRRDHWVLKCPSHLFGLDALLATFPDAAVVQTHRDPVAAIPSMASLSAALDSLEYAVVDREEVGRRTVEKFELVMERSLRVRREAAGARFFDVAYNELVRDPASVVREIYGHFEYEYSETMAGAVRTYLAASRQHRHGVHRYSLEDFALERAALQERFAPYCDYFDVRPEDRAAAAGTTAAGAPPPTLPAGTTLGTSKSIAQGEVVVQYHEAGAGETVVLLPGLGRAAREYNALAAGLNAAGYRTVAVELRGVGESKGPRNPRPTLQDLAGDVARVVASLPDLPGGKVHLVGRALGNRVARCVAEDRPDLVRSLVLLAAGGRVGPTSRIGWRYLVFGTRLTPRKRRERFYRDLLYAKGNEPEPGFEQSLTLRALSQQARAARTPVEKWWLGGSAPILVLQGEEDRIAPPANAYALRDDAPDRVEVVLLPGAGHALLPEQPARILEEVLRFIRQHPV